MNKQHVSVSMCIKGIRGSAVHASLSTKRENLAELIVDHADDYIDYLMHIISYCRWYSCGLLHTE